jgi:large subunit ribosomal protein L3
MIGLIGKKIGMTQVFDDNGVMIPITVIKAGPCHVVKRKTLEKDKYDAVQLGFEKIDEKRLTKPIRGYFVKQNSPTFRYLKEFRLKIYKDIKEGEVFDASMFTENEIITISGVSKGKGFAGVMKRHNFAGFKQTHGVHESFRGPGSIGQCATPARVFKGMKMAGHLGCDNVTVKNIRIIKVDVQRNLLLVKGAVPGHRNSIVTMSKEL